MSAPQMKEGPASSMLRAMFAGFGSLMSVMDRVRNKPPAEAPADAEATATEFWDARVLRRQCIQVHECQGRQPFCPLPDPAGRGRACADS